MIFEVRSIATRRSLRTPQDGPKQSQDDPWTPQGDSKMAPRRFQDGYKTVPRRPKTAPRRPRTLQDRPKTSQDHPKTLQDRSKTLQDRSKTPQDRTRTLQDRSKTAPRFAPKRCKTFPKAPLRPHHPKAIPRHQATQIWA